MHSQDALMCMFTAHVSVDDDGTYSIDVPDDEVEIGPITPGEPVRVGIREHPDSADARRSEQASSKARRAQSDAAHQSEPPITEGDVETVTVTSIGDQGDGVAKLDGGYVVFVPDTEVGEEVNARIKSVHDTYAMAERADAVEDGISYR